MEAQGFEAVVNNWAEKHLGYPDDFWAEPDEYFKEPTQVSASVVTIELIDSQLGGEDKFAGGEGDVWLVWKVTIDGVPSYFKKSGVYRSYTGTAWGEITKVTPKTKTITVFE